MEPTANLNLIRNLMDMIPHMDHNSLQRLNDFAKGLLGTSPVKDDWWAELDEETKQGILASDMDIDDGNFVSKEELFFKYQHLL